MSNETLVERLGLVKTAGINIGLPEKHAEVLAKISLRKNLDTRVCKLLKMLQGSYSEMMVRYNELLDDPTAFYYANKTLKIGSRKFPAYGNVSLAYSLCSPYQLVLFVMEDASTVEDLAIMEAELSDDGLNGEWGAEEEPGEGVLLEPEYGPEYDYFSLDSQRFERYYRAFRHDLEGNRIPSDLVEKLLNALDWENRPAEKDLMGLDSWSKYEVMDSFYIFFSSEEGEQFIEQWKHKESPEKLLDRFTYLVYNDPRVNPHLIGMGLKDVGTKRYEERCASFGEDKIYRADGTCRKRAEVDARKSTIG